MDYLKPTRPANSRLRFFPMLANEFELFIADVEDLIPYDWDNVFTALSYHQKFGDDLVRRLWVAARNSVPFLVGRAMAEYSEDYTNYADLLRYVRKHLDPTIEAPWDDLPPYISVEPSYLPSRYNSKYNPANPVTDKDHEMMARLKRYWGEAIAAGLAS